LVDIPNDATLDEKLERTREAMRAGARVIYQAALRDGRFMGHADFLRRVEGKSGLGDFRYEVLDTKLALKTKAKFLIQLACYSDLVAGAQGVLPEREHLVLGDGTEVRRRLRRRASHHGSCFTGDRREAAHLLLALEVVAQADDAHVAEFAQGEQCAVACDDDICTSRNGTFEDAIIRVILEYLQPAARPRYGGQLAQKHRDMGQLFGIAREFSGEHAEQLVEDGLGKDELIALFDDAPKSRLALPAWKHQC
jgi:hypothetical protein